VRGREGRHAPARSTTTRSSCAASRAVAADGAARPLRACAPSREHVSPGSAAEERPLAGALRGQGRGPDGCLAPAVRGHTLEASRVASLGKACDGKGAMREGQLGGAGDGPAAKLSGPPASGPPSRCAGGRTIPRASVPVGTPGRCSMMSPRRAIISRLWRGRGPVSTIGTWGKRDVPFCRKKGPAFCHLGEPKYGPK
jgi:hypothetical protein